MQRIKSIEFIRFLFAIIICYHHLIIGLSKIYVDNSLIIYLKNLTYGGLGVDFFFIIAGFFLYFSLCKTNNLLDFIIHKIKRLWPVLAFSTIVAACLAPNVHVSQVILNLLFLQNIPLSKYPHFNTAAWFVSSLFWVSIFYAGIVNSFSKKISNYLIGVITFVFFNLYFSGIAEGRVEDVIFPFLTSGMIRGVGGIGLGYLLGVFYINIKDKVTDYISKYNKFFVIFSTIFEVTLFIFIILALLFSKLYIVNSFVLIVAFVLFFLLLLFNIGYFSRLLSNDFSVICGRYSYSIYLMQVSYNICARKTLWLNAQFINEHIISFIILNILLYILLGIIVYYCIELPSYKYLKKRG